MAYNKEYYQKHKDKIYESQLKYNQANREKVNALSRGYYYRHREEILQKLKQKRSKNNEQSDSNNG